MYSANSRVVVLVRRRTHVQPNKNADGDLLAADSDCTKKTHRVEMWIAEAENEQIHVDLPLHL